MRLRLRDAVALATATYSLSVSAKLLYPGFYTDILTLYYRNILPTKNGIPYRDYSLQYPAIPAIMMWIGGHAPSAQYFMAVTAFMTYIFVIGTTYFLYRTCTDFGLDRGRLIPFFIMAPSFLALSFFNWDIIAVCFVSGAIYYSFKKSHRVSGLCIGLGFATKSYPLLLLPAFLKEMQTWPDRLEMLLSTVLGCLIPNLPFILIDFSSLIRAYNTTYSTVYVENSIWLVVRYFNPADQDWLILAIVWSTIFLVILHTTFSHKPLVLKAWIILAVTILVYPSYPPQYDLWLLPMFVLAPTFGLIPFLAFDFLNTSIAFSWFQVDNPFQPWGVIWDISLIRVGILVGLLIWVARRKTPAN